MADSPDTTPDAAQVQADAEKARTQEAKAQARTRERETAKQGEDSPEEFPIERLQDEAPSFFGVGAHVVAGALVHAKITKKNATIAEVQEAIEDFGQRVTNQPEGEE